jgi:glycosyltransferase involved in cell wall biosynthesis
MIEVSIIVPTLDRVGQLATSLASIGDQVTDARFEVIVVDNGSTDGTPALLEDWCRHDGRFRSIREERPGRSSAMNAGIMAATGSLLLFTDDDVELRPGWVEAFRRSLAQLDPTSTIAGGVISPAPPDLSSWPGWLSEESLADGPGLDHGPEERRLAPHEFIWGASMAVPSKVFERLGTWDESVGRRGDHRGTYEDIEFQQRLRRAGGEVWWVPDARLRHRVPSDDITPRRILDRAYRNGRNAAWFTRGTTPASGVPATARAFWRWLLGVVGFRLRPGADRYDIARQAARAAGATGEATARRRSRARAPIQWAAWLGSRAIIRLAPDRR